jgi:hypothetical protein
MPIIWSTEEAQLAVEDCFLMLTTTQRAEDLHGADRIVSDFYEITVAQIRTLIQNRGRTA